MDHCPDCVVPKPTSVTCTIHVASTGPPPLQDVPPLYSTVTFQNQKPSVVSSHDRAVIVSSKQTSFPGFVSFPIVSTKSGPSVSKHVSTTASGPFVALPSCSTVTSGNGTRQSVLSSIDNASNIAARSNDEGISRVSNRRPRGTRAGIQRQQERFMRFLYRLSSAHYNWGRTTRRNTNQQHPPNRYE
ncbi:PREDICTED: uncharacterized protein LOC105449069 [Wasmannia auropunctata]|uniref:uncharacterized protein LOC105449069 n=1 Tax=Wasmannia auropunctata TaxID=64793 RepID=UPI0005F01F50|nr:PREDICTED: uncharacterized protein LOC105449069 [Wasmannia auropunctata]